MIGGALGEARGDLMPGFVEAALKTPYKLRVPLAPAEGLVLESQVCTVPIPSCRMCVLSRTADVAVPKKRFAHEGGKDFFISNTQRQDRQAGKAVGFEFFYFLFFDTVPRFVRQRLVFWTDPKSNP